MPFTPAFNIYYGVSVSGAGVSREKVRRHIAILRRFGNVMTEHLGNEVSKIDGTETAYDIYNPS